MNTRQILLGLNEILGPQRLGKALQVLSVTELWYSDITEIVRTMNWRKSTIETFIQKRGCLNLSQIEELLWQSNIKYLCIGDKDYPPMLANIFDPPPIIYVQGNPSLLQAPSIAVVGSRKPTAYGRGVAQNLARDLAERGLTIVSGLARGIDTMAHVGALEGGKTIAVIGSGLDIAYPPENKRLQQRIPKTGAVISEFPLGSRPEVWHFPMRNRIISGLTLGTIVVEAEAESGSLITADAALEQGREVFAVPGPITSRLSVGCHNLLKQGAKLVAGVSDITEELFGVGTEVNCLSKAKEQSLFEQNRSVEEQQIIRVIQDMGAPNIDQIVEGVGLPVSRIAFMLTTLEMEGIIVKGNGQIYSLKQPILPVC